MKKLTIAVFCLTALCWPVMAQSNAPARPVSAAVTNTVIAITGATGSVTTPTLSTALGQVINAGYLYVATNGAVAAGLGNTLDKLGKGQFETLMTESIDLPSFLPTNNVLTLNAEFVTSQLYAPDKTHLGLGVGISTLWHVGWLQKLHLGPLSTLKGIMVKAFIAPDVDKAINLEFNQRDTVAGVDAGLYWQF